MLFLEASQLEACSSLPAPEHAPREVCDSQSDRIRKAIELRSERARAILTSHKPLLTRHNNLAPSAPRLPSPCRQMDILRTSSTDAMTAKARSLPLPLTDAVLNEAYTQLSSGAKISIQSVVHWWRTNKLSAHEVLATVESFAGSSAALRRIFASATPEPQKVSPRYGLIVIQSIGGKVASEGEMRELMCV